MIWEKVRIICIQNNLYTNGSNWNYENLYNNIKNGEFTIDDIITDVYVHSFNIKYNKVVELFTM